MRIGESTTLEMHNRLQLQLSSTPFGPGASVAGFGVSTVPGRSVNLTTRFVDRERLRAWHDVDRLAMTVYTPVGDLTFGRQAITWGISNLFPVADLWAQFSPFELDTEEKPGADGVRLLSYPADGLELDFVVVDRGRSEDLSAAVRASLSLSWADLHGAAGKFWNEALLMAGASMPVRNWKLRAEGVVPYDLDESRGRLPRVTAGIDRLGGETLLSAEYHFNGIGATRPERYMEVLADPRFARGESYFLGRHYLGGLAMWTPGNDRLSLTVNALWNLGDPSAAITGVFTYDFGQETRLSLGAMVTSGTPPEASQAALTFSSEYGSYGSLAFTRLSVYF